MIVSAFLTVLRAKYIEPKITRKKLKIEDKSILTLWCMKLRVTRKDLKTEDKNILTFLNFDGLELTRSFFKISMVFNPHIVTNVNVLILA
jgi:hypothetical protein